MQTTEKHRQKTGEPATEEDRSKRADAGIAPEQSEQPNPDTPKQPDNRPVNRDDNRDDIDEPDDLVDPREKRQDPPVPDQPTKIRVEK